MSIIDFRVREELAGAVLKEVAALEPAERLKQSQALMQILGQAVQGLEHLWEEFRAPLEKGVSPADAVTLGQILTRSANFIGSSLELLVQDGPVLEEFRESSLARLQRIKTRAASLRQLIDMPSPSSDPNRLRSSLEQMERGDGVDAGEFLAELKG